MFKIGYDNDKYLRTQSSKILERIEEFGGKLYLEFGGKLFDDFHASRVLPGFQPDSKVKMLLEMKDDAEIVVVISAEDIEKNKVRGDLGITYDQDVLRLIDAFRGIGLYVGSVVITKYKEQPQAVKFDKRLQQLGMKVYHHYTIEGYPSNTNHIVSDDGLGKNDYIETSRKLVVVTAPGPGSGKMATCISQLYQDSKRGIKSGYAKFETFPIWNMPLSHPVNLAYEAATADLDDVNMIDPYHLEAYGVTTVNYNRDIEIFPVLNTIFKKIYGYSPYNSPTDMGVNMIGNCIIDDEVVKEASKQEIIRRYYSTLCQIRQGMASPAEANRIELIMEKAGIDESIRPCIKAAQEKSEKTNNQPAFAIELNDGKIITGRTSYLLGPSSAALLNALKYLANIPDDVLLMSPSIIEPIQELKTKTMGNRNPRLHTDEILIALSICAVSDEKAKKALEALPLLKHAEAHSTVILSRVDESTLKKLGLNVTCSPQYQSKKLYHA